MTHLKAGVILTSRSPDVGDGYLETGTKVAHLSLGGLDPEDAHLLAISLLDRLKIDRSCAPYAELRELLNMLDYHPLSIQLVLSALNRLSLAEIRDGFAALLPQFTHDEDGGPNGSLLASLEYSLQRLRPEYWVFLHRLAIFEGGASEAELLAISDIPESIWANLSKTMEQMALLRVEHVGPKRIPFLRFHPVLTPFLRSQGGKGASALMDRYAAHYCTFGDHLYRSDLRDPEHARAVARRELPNLRRALDLLVEAGNQDDAIHLSEVIIRFSAIFGSHRERNELRRHMAELFPPTSGMLTQAKYELQSRMAEDEWNRGNIHVAIESFGTTPLNRGE